MVSVEIGRLREFEEHSEILSVKLESGDSDDGWQRSDTGRPNSYDD